MAQPLRFGLVTPQLVPWPAMVERWQRAERLGFDSVWVVDHFVNPAFATGRWFDGWTMLAALATQTERVRLGVLVTSISFRNPTLLAKEALTVDHISGGRLELGLGAGGQVNDHRMTGSEPWPPAERVARFREFVAVVDALLREAGETSYDGRYYRVENAIMTPGSVQQPRPPITIGASGPAMIKLTAEHADSFNTSGGGGSLRGGVPPSTEEAVETVRRRNALLDEECAKRGRDPGSITRSLLAGGGSSPEDPWISVGAFEDFVGRYRDAGINEFLFYYPSRTELAHDTFEPIAHEVMPRLRLERAPIG